MSNANFVVKIGKYIRVVWVGESKSRLTSIYKVESKANVKLGAIKWHGQWRKYVFCPSPNTIFDESCLDEISSFLMQITMNHKQETK